MQDYINFFDDNDTLLIKYRVCNTNIIIILYLRKLKIPLL
jgi:hypothetical protein